MLVAFFWLPRTRKSRFFLPFGGEGGGKKLIQMPPPLVPVHISWGWGPLDVLLFFFSFFLFRPSYASNFYFSVMFATCAALQNRIVCQGNEWLTVCFCHSCLCCSRRAACRSRFACSTSCSCSSVCCLSRSTWVFCSVLVSISISSCTWVKPKVDFPKKANKKRGISLAYFLFLVYVT